MAPKKKAAKKADEPKLSVAAREAERRQEREDAVKVDASLDVKLDGRVATFSGEGYHPGKPSVMLHFGDGSQRRIGTVDGKMADAIHEYPNGSAPFEAWTESADGEHLAKRKVSIK